MEEYQCEKASRGYEFRAGWQYSQIEETISPLAPGLMGDWMVPPRRAMKRK